MFCRVPHGICEGECPSTARVPARGGSLHALLAAGRFAWKRRLIDHGIPLRVPSGHVATGSFLRPRLVGRLILSALILVNSVIGVNSAAGSFETRLFGDA